jgi:hypothetical protein
MEESAIEFSEEAGGRMISLAMHSEASTPAKAPQREPSSDSPETANN